ncbi:regulatory particle non-ATPase [Malassezia vespertilionis]|uniref:PCI domain-containing protein n=1 Tax=Malassezia vespertilionis TaxID=2020962 RepID=A0A2N1JCI2_9BASI|nr:regulatory particle non-ATPase [Malassezia vespertilionis]PKI84246.1 hypothetical protein MVES_001555 [Malassezia vespertilionis]WFD06308.1 regulatory particle non-ATPase [Malassezia vespertilionis]
MADAALKAACTELQRQFHALESSTSNEMQQLSEIGAQLSELKLMLTDHDLLYPHDAHNQEALVLAREVFEIGVLWSIRVHDIDSFDRFWNQLKPFYLDLRDKLPPSPNHEPIIGLSLMRDIATNEISAFHIALEMLPVDFVRDSKYIQHPVLLERWLMEGSYSNVWRERQNVPRKEYQYFVDMLIETIRHEIASCEEKAYDTLPLNDVATLLFFDSLPEVLTFAKERGWQVNPTTQTVEFANKGKDSVNEEKIPMRATIASSLQYARELESIV